MKNIQLSAGDGSCLHVRPTGLRQRRGPITDLHHPQWILAFDVAKNTTKGTQGLWTS